MVGNELQRLKLLCSAYQVVLEKSNMVVPVNIISVLLISITLYFYESISISFLAVWTLLITAVSLMRLLHGKFLLSKGIITENIKKIRVFVLAGIAINALIWSGGFIFIAPELSFENQMLILWILGGLATGAQSSLGYDRQTYLIFITPLLLPIALWFLFQMNLLVAAFVFALMAALIITASMFGKNTKEILELRTENVSLITSSNPIYNALFNTAIDAIIIINEKQDISLCNRQAEIMFGYKKSELIGRPITTLIPRKHRKAHPKMVRSFSDSNENKKYMDQREPVSGLRKDGSEFPCEISIAKLQSPEGNYFSATVSDLSEKHEYQRKIYQLAMYDELTGLANRTKMNECITKRQGQLVTETNKLSVILIGLNRFKAINEVMGRDAGDKVLKNVAKGLKHFEKDSSCLSRFGGDVFSLVYSDIEVKDEIIKKCIDILSLFTTTIIVKNVSLDVSACIGISVSPDNGVSTSELVTKAEIALNMAKKEKKGFLFYDDKMKSYNEDTLSLAGELKAAIEGESLEVYYQAKQEIGTKYIYGAEALIRWNHPEKGFVSPALFIPIAEQTGMISTITQWVIEQSIINIVRWQSLGLTIKVSVNISTQDLEDSAFVDKLSNLLSRYGVQADLLTLELTETDLMIDPDIAKETLKKLRALGVHLSIDDFGTGYSSLSYLNELNVDELKIDRSFIFDMMSNDKHICIVKTIIHLAHDLGLTVTAEGIETEEALNQLKEFNCESAQGYFIAKPKSSDDFFNWITASRNRADNYHEEDC